MDEYIKLKEMKDKLVNENVFKLYRRDVNKVVEGLQKVLNEQPHAMNILCNIRIPIEGNTLYSHLTAIGLIEMILDMPGKIAHKVEENGKISGFVNTEYLDKVKSTLPIKKEV